MESYYDSDDDVAWGPCTLREIKRIFRDPPRKKVNNRQTVQLMCQTENTKQSQGIIKEQVVQKYNVTSSSSEYCTPNETVNTVYGSCAEEVVENSNVDSINLIKYNKSALELRDIRQTLIENSYSCDSLDSSTVETVNTSSQSSSHSVIVLSDDDADTSFIVSKIKMQPKISELNYIDDNENSAKCPAQTISNSNNELVYEELESLHSDTSAIDSPTSIELEPPRNCPNFSPVEVPKINFAAFDDTDDCLELNNTLDEIERMLNASFSSNHSLRSSEPCSDETPALPLASPIVPTSGSFLQTPSRALLNKVTSNKTNIKTNIPVFGSASPSNTNKLKTVTNSKVCTESKVAIGQFKMPKTPSNLTTINVKNIVSPVGVYIKYGKTCPLIQNVHTPSENKKTNVIVHSCREPRPPCNKLVVENKENMNELPAVVYKPASRKEYKTNEKLVLPPSIEKMVVKCNVVRHEKRIVGVQKREEDINRKLDVEFDLTKSSIGESLLNDTHDVSVLVSKPGYKKV